MVGRTQRGAFQGSGQPSAQISVPAPINGLNTRDAISAMSALDATLMKNVFPGTGSVESRKGYSADAVTGMTGNVETLVEFHQGSTRKFLAAAGSRLYDATSATASELKNGFSNARWSMAMFNNGQVWCNGADTPQVFNGTAFADLSATGSGLDVTKFIGVVNFKSRAFYWETDSPAFWYASTAGAFQGALSKFNLGEVANRGGNLVDIQTWTRDGGSGADDFAVFIMSSGETLIYQGIDPGDASSWSLVGRFNLGEPIHRRASEQFGSDVAIVTKSDLEFLQGSLPSGFVNNGISKLTGAISEAAKEYEANFGWQVILYPKGNMLLINIPVSTGTNYIQYGINTITGAAFGPWSGWNALCFGIYNGDLYFGGNGVIHKADTGFTDGGESIDTEIEQAFSNFNSMAKKRMTMFAPILEADGNIEFGFVVTVDYGTGNIAQTAVSPSVGTPWGSPWGSPWSPQNRTRQDRFTGTGLGRAFALKIAARLSGQQYKWHATDYYYQPQTRF